MSLRHHQAAFRLDGAGAERPLSARAREHDRHGALVCGLGQRPQEVVDGAPEAPPIGHLADAEQTLIDRQRAIGRNDVDMIRLELAAKNALRASSPPADAPIPTIVDPPCPTAGEVWAGMVLTRPALNARELDADVLRFWARGMLASRGIGDLNPAAQTFMLAD